MGVRLGMAPGGRDIRKVTLKDELTRILCCGGLLIFSGSAFTLSLYWDMSNLGPLLGIGIGALLFAYGARWFQIRYPKRTAYILAVLLIFLVAWGFLGWEFLLTFWPMRMHLPYVWVLFTTLISLIAKFAFGHMFWASWSEMVDPNGPTAPRMATPRDKTISPFSRETFGGKQLPDEVLLSHPVSRTVKVEISSNNGRTKEYFVGIPDTLAWKSFARSVVGKPSNFTESEAKAHKVKLDDTLDGQGEIIQFGMRTIRSRLIARGFARWKNPQVHERGLIMLKKGLAVLRAASSG